MYEYIQNVFVCKDMFLTVTICPTDQHANDSCVSGPGRVMEYSSTSCCGPWAVLLHTGCKQWHGFHACRWTWWSVSSIRFLPEDSLYFYIQLWVSGQKRPFLFPQTQDMAQSTCPMIVALYTPNLLSATCTPQQEEKPTSPMSPPFAESSSPVFCLKVGIHFSKWRTVDSPWLFELKGGCQADTWPSSCHARPSLYRFFLFLFFPMPQQF